MEDRDSQLATVVSGTGHNHCDGKDGSGRPSRQQSIASEQNLPRIEREKNDGTTAIYNEASNKS